MKLLLGTNFLIGPGHSVCFSNGCTFVRFEALTMVALKMTAFFFIRHSHAVAVEACSSHVAHRWQLCVRECHLKDNGVTQFIVLTRHKSELGRKEGRRG